MLLVELRMFATSFGNFKLLILRFLVSLIGVEALSSYFSKKNNIEPFLESYAKKLDHDSSLKFAKVKASDLLSKEITYIAASLEKHIAGDKLPLLVENFTDPNIFFDPLTIKQINGIFANKANISFSQEGEDILVRRILKEKFYQYENPLYLDIGSYHPIKYSNTYLMYVYGWRGLHVEANREAASKIESSRVGDKVISALLTEKNEVRKYYMFLEGAYNTLDEERAKFIVDNKISEIKEVRELNSLTIDTILDDSFWIGREQDLKFVNIDIEGEELNIIRDFDFERFKPEILCIEELSSEIGGIICDILNDKGYAKFSKLSNSTIYLRQ